MSPLCQKVPSRSPRPSVSPGGAKIALEDEPTPNHHRFPRTVVVPCSTRKPRGKQVATITEWLASLGLPEYAQRFADNSIDDVSILRHLTDQDLKEIGVSLGHRRKILASIAEQLAGAAPARSQPAAPPEPKPRDDAERRQLTVMFTDLVGSTALSTRLD